MDIRKLPATYALIFTKRMMTLVVILFEATILKSNQIQFFSLTSLCQIVITKRFSVQMSKQQ